MGDSEAINFKCLFTKVFKTFKLILQFNKFYLLVYFFLAIINSLLPFVSLIITQTLINYLQVGSKDINMLLTLFMMFCVISVLSTIITNLLNYVGTKYNLYLYYELNKLLIYKTKYLMLKDYENNYTYDLLQRAENDIGVRPFQTITIVINLFSSLISVISSLIILFSWHAWTLFGFIILPFFAYKYFIQINSKEFKMLYNRSQYERKSWYIAHLLTKDEYIKEVRNLNLFDYLFNKFKKLRKRFFNENTKLEKQKSTFSFIYQILNSSVTLFIVYHAIIETFNSKIMLGNLTTYINTTEKVENSIRSIVGSIFSLHQNCLYIDNIFMFFDYCDSKEAEQLSSGESITDFDLIEFKNVSYKYPLRKEYALKDISFVLRKGDTVALVGDNGSGKSTLLKILSGMYTDYEGSILIDGIELRNIKSDSLMEHISVIFQDYNKYQFTVNENIGFGNIKEVNSEKNIRKAAELSQAHEFIKTLENKYEQQVGVWFENGTQLSGGQWQKLAISRLFMRNTASLFILDEPTSALDTISEFNFFQEFSQTIKGAITIFSTHRFVSAKFSNKILVLDDGYLIEEGTHDNLIMLNGKYHKMYNYYLKSYQLIHE